ncbi:MAG: four helix bundle protein [Armatimonadetes bacterium]|nr:four helix bundle protein [Armatimonadota bacterium]
MALVNSHRDLIVWQKAMDLAVCVYQLSKSFPKSEIYGMTSQLTRAVASVPANNCYARYNKIIDKRMYWVQSGLFPVPCSLFPSFQEQT